MPHDRNRRLRRGHDDLHGNVPDQSQVVLLLIDVINDLNFPDNQAPGPPIRSAGEVDRQTEEAVQKVGYPNNLRQRQSGPMAF